MSWDDVRGELWLGDVGERAWEEINVIQSGKDYGWNLIEGEVCFSRQRDCRSYLDSTYMRAVVIHPHPNYCPTNTSATCHSANSLIGGVWYYGSAVTSLQNKYVYGDWTGGHIYALSLSNRAQPLQGTPTVTRVVPDFTPALATEFHPSVVMKDNRGEILVANWWEPQIWKITEEAASMVSSAHARADGVDVSTEGWFSGGMDSLGDSSQV